jgi:flagellar basal body rod protein FlgG
MSRGVQYDVIVIGGGASGMMAQQLNVDNISNNIANMTTTGYKRSRVEFKDLMKKITLNLVMHLG